MAEAEVETPSDLNGVAVEIAKGDEVRTEIGLIRADQFRFQARMRWA
jgi:predicted nucleotide-binding protein